LKLEENKSIFRNRLLVTILIPVLGIGILFSVILTRLLVPPLISLLKSRTDATLKNASDMGIQICEERFSDLMELRLESNQEMNSYYRKEAIEEIKAISRRFPGIQMLIIDQDRKTLASTRDVHNKNRSLPELQKMKTGIVTGSFWGESVRMHYHYFPFWRWHIISFISEKDYMAPILMAERIVGFGTAGVLIVVLMAVTWLFIWRVNRPLKEIISATEDVSKGRLNTIEVRRKDEIAQVALAFNSMVQSLIEDKQKIKSIMAELRDSEERYRSITEYALAHISIVKKERYTFANNMMLRVLGYAYEDFVGLNFWEIVHPEDRKLVQENILALENGDVNRAHFECRYQNAKGETLWFEILATLILYQEENAVLLHAIDITARKTEQLERRKLEKKLSRAQKMEAIGTLAGGVAHDLNNLLSGLVSYPELLLMDLPQDSPFREPILTIKKSGVNAAAIVQDLLTLARRGVAVTEVINNNHIISEYLQSHEFEKLKSFHPDISIETNLEADLLNIKGSSVHLTKTIMNLISNAVEAIPDVGKVTISTKNQYVDRPIKGYDDVKEGDYVVITVTDNGVGISAEEIDRIFEPFYPKKQWEEAELV